MDRCFLCLLAMVCIYETFKYYYGRRTNFENSFKETKH